MVVKRKATMYISSFSLLIAIFLIFFLDNVNKPYGNDKESIIKVIKSIEGYEDELVEILEIKDINDKRIVGFLSNNDPAYIEFTRNQKGNYEWRHIQKSAGQSFASHIIHLTRDENATSYFIIITNEENNIAKMELGVNDQVIERDFSVNKKAVSWIELPEPQSNSYTFNYKYYNKDGNLIVEY